MKILFASITDSGILRVRSELIQELHQMGHSVIVATPKEKDYKTLVQMGCKHINVNIQRLGMNPFADISAYLQYVNILKKVKPDIVFLFTTKPNIYCGIACRRLGIPAIMNITGMGSALAKKGIVQKIMILMYKLSTNGSNIRCIFFQNDDSMNFFKRHHIGNQKVFKRIPGSGVNLEKFQVLPYPTSSKTVDFLFVARVMKAKGIEEYIAAAKETRKKYTNAVFHVLGSCDEDYKSILAEETKNGNIVYHGRVDNIPDYQLISQCTIQPSYYPEGMSNVILEAAASGRPVITTDHPGCREGVEDGVTGYIIPIKDTSALVTAIKKMIDIGYNERSKMGICGRKKMETEFDRKIVTNAYIDILKKQR